MLMLNLSTSEDCNAIPAQRSVFRKRHALRIWIKKQKLGDIVIHESFAYRDIHLCFA
jgi:hypothetical protein